MTATGFVPGVDAPTRRALIDLEKRINDTTDSAGFITMYGGGSAPSGWLMCDGSAVSRVTYATLFNVIGTSYGAGDGATTFNLPNLNAAFPMGGSPGITGGSADAVVVDHSHTASTDSDVHSHGYRDHYRDNDAIVDDSGTGTDRGYHPDLPYSNRTTDSDTHDHAVTVNSTGVAGTNANLPPYVGVSFVIKT